MNGFDTNKFQIRFHGRYNVKLDDITNDSMCRLAHVDNTQSNVVIYM